MGGVWAAESKEVWWLATNLKLPVADIVALGERRMSGAEPLPDAKGAARCGAQPQWTEFKSGEYLEQMYLANI